MAFNPGDVVKLKSDGPLMTVLGEKRDTGLIGVAWFNADLDLRVSELPASTLKPVDSGGGAFSGGDLGIPERPL